MAPGLHGSAKWVSCLFACVLTTVALRGVVCASDRPGGGELRMPPSFGNSSDDAEIKAQASTEERRVLDEWKKMQGIRSQDSGDSDWQDAGLLTLAMIGIMVVVALAFRGR